MATVVAFDFANKREEAIPVGAAPEACSAGRFCWIDIDSASDMDTSLAGGLLRDLCIPAAVIAAALREDDRDRYDIHDDCVHFRVFAAKFDADRFAGLPVDLILGDRFLVTLRRGDV